MPITYANGKRFFNGLEIDDIEIDGVDTRDYPDFCDAYINNMWLVDGDEVREATDAELEDINDNERDFVYDEVYDSIF